MEKLNHTIRINSKNEKELIHPSELLLPLNGMVNLINFLENVEDEYKKFESRSRMRNDQFDFDRFIKSRLRFSRHHIKTFNDNNCVTIKAMSKKSPYWVDLVIGVSPYVIETLNCLIERNHEDLTNKLVQLWNKVPVLNRVSDKHSYAGEIIRCFLLISRYVNISIDRN
jgi:hypothetical protein